MNRNDAVGSRQLGELSSSNGPYNSESKERGTRRRKLAGYLKAANELRQSYQQAHTSPWGTQEEPANGQKTSGTLDDICIVGGGNEGMMLFPSYARRHIKRDPVQMNLDQVQLVDRRGADTSRSDAFEDADYWRQQLEKREGDRAIVEVDVRGWVYSPHRGPLTRKNRLLIGLARQLSGIPAPTSNVVGGSDGSQSDDSLSGRTTRSHHLSRFILPQIEQKLVNKEAELIARKGTREASVADRGGYNEGAASIERTNIYGSLLEPSAQKDMRDTTTDGLSKAGQDDIDRRNSSLKRLSWNQPPDMSPTELAAANTNLRSRLEPFLSSPRVHIPITVFFFNKDISQSRTVETNDAGHFILRAPLDFVPTHLRVLASEGLSATEEVIITEPEGVSLISDVDDTIKHSDIGSGAKEMFRNTFIRDIEDLNIEGVREWYRGLVDLGVKIHYVSNSPWQLYPLLVGFFSSAGLPPGSFHLKQYSGMLQGIFEPVAERKKGSLERIIRDFPQRKFILVGDSGEADLEVYTDVALANPGRVIGIYIRDNTTQKKHPFFDPSIGSTGHAKGSSTSNGTGPTGKGGSYGGNLDSSQEDHGWSTPIQSDTLSRVRSNRRTSQSDPDIDLAAPTSEIFRLSGLGSGNQQGPMKPRRSSSGAPDPPAKPRLLRLSASPREGLEAFNGENNRGNGSVLTRSPPPIPPKPAAYSQRGESKSLVSNEKPDDRYQSGSAHTPATYSKDIPRRTVTTAYNKVPATLGAFRNNKSSVQPILLPEGEGSGAPLELPHRVSPLFASSASSTGGQLGIQTSASENPAINVTSHIRKNFAGDAEGESRHVDRHPSVQITSPMPPTLTMQPPPPLPPRGQISYPDAASAGTQVGFVPGALPHRTTSNLDHRSANSSSSANNQFMSYYASKSSPSLSTQASSVGDVATRGSIASANTGSRLRPPPASLLSSSTNGTIKTDGRAPNTTTVTTDNTNNNYNSIGNKIEELWRRRWLRAHNLLQGQGVRLRSWRVGQDVLQDSIDLVRHTHQSLSSTTSSSSSVSTSPWATAAAAVVTARPAPAAKSSVANTRT